MCDPGPKTQTEDQPPSIADIVREETDNGRLIVRVLIDIALGQGDEIKTCHQLEATRQLTALGVEIPQAAIQAAAKPAKARTQSTAPTRTASSSQDNELADIIKQETSDGRDVVRFLVDVMHGNLDGFKPCHRVASAKELLRRGFDHTHAYSGDDDQDRDDDPISQERLENQTRHNAKQYNDDGDPFDFDNYDREDYIRDRMGHRAELHIFGSEEAREVALHTAREFGRESRAAGHIGDYDYSPIENPEDDPYGKGCYGYKVLRIGFQNNNVIRAVNKAVAEYHKRKFKHLIDKDGSLTAPADTASLDPRTLQYLERSRHLLAEENGKPPVGPDPPSSVTPEQPHDHPVGADLKPARGLTHPSTERDSEPPECHPEQPQDHPVEPGLKPTRGLAHPSTERDSEPPNVILERSHVILSEAEGSPAPTPPPRKRSAIIYTGPPDEGPRLVRDPGGFQAAVDKVLSSGPL